LGRGASAGILFAHPPPQESALPSSEMESLVAQAVESAEAHGVQGQGVTPFLLKEMARLSRSRTLQANIALLVANADLAGRIAFAYCANQAPFRGERASKRQIRDL